MVFSIRTAPHLATNMSFGAIIISVWEHREPGSADRSTVFIYTDVVMDRFGMTAFAVEVDQGTYLPIFEKPVSGKIVHGRIQAYILYRKTRHMFFQLMESNKKGYGIMAFGAGEAEQQRDIRMQYRIVAGKLEQSITKVKGIKVAVPSPGSIRIRIMSWERSIFLRGNSLVRVRQAVSVWVRMGMDSRTVTGYGKRVFGNEAALKGGEYSDNENKFLGRASKLKGISFPSIIRETRESVMEERVSEAFWCLPLGLLGFLRFQPGERSLSLL